MTYHLTLINGNKPHVLFTGDVRLCQLKRSELVKSGHKKSQLLIRTEGGLTAAPGWKPKKR